MLWFAGKISNDSNWRLVELIIIIIINLQGSTVTLIRIFSSQELIRLNFSLFLNQSGFISVIWNFHSTFIISCY